MLNAEQVRKLVAEKWPDAMTSPLAQAMRGASSMALLEASDADAVALRGAGLEQARACLEARDGWTVETLSVQVECAVDGLLDESECDEIAKQALREADLSAA